MRNDTGGRYLDRYMFATQMEYRLVFRWRLGLIGFGGFGGVAPEIGQFRGDEFLPAGGRAFAFY